MIVSARLFGACTPSRPEEKVALLASDRYADLARFKIGKVAGIQGGPVLLELYPLFMPRRYRRATVGSNDHATSEITLRVSFDPLQLPLLNTKSKMT